MNVSNMVEQARVARYRRDIIASNMRIRLASLQISDSFKVVSARTTGFPWQIPQSCSWIGLHERDVGLK